MDKEYIIIEGFTFRKDSILKCEEISWRCTSSKQKCKAKLRLFLDASKVRGFDTQPWSKYTEDWTEDTKGHKKTKLADLIFIHRMSLSFIYLDQ